MHGRKQPRRGGQFTARAAGSAQLWAQGYVSSSLPLPAFAAGPTTIVDQWSSVQVPPPPVLKPVTVVPATTAFLILDLVKQTCNTEVRLRCAAAIPKIAALLACATDNGILVGHRPLCGSPASGSAIHARGSRSERAGSRS